MERLQGFARTVQRRARGLAARTRKGWGSRTRGTSGRIALALAIILLTPLVLLIALVLVAESEWAERRIEQFASERLDREVHLDEIDMRLGWPPRIHLQTLRVSNPEWAKTKNLVDAQDLTAAVRVWPLFSGELVIEMLSVASGRAGLEQEGDRATWRFGPRDTKSRVHVQEAQIGDGWIYYRDADADTALHIRASGGLGPDSAAANIKAEGRFRGQIAKASAQAPFIPIASDRPIRGSLEATVGDTSGSASGTIQVGDGGIQALDAEVALKGPTLGELYDIVRIDLPNTPPYSLQGRLRHENGVWTFEPFSGELGDSDLRGSWSYDTRGSKPMLRADITSKSLDFDDLAPLVGAPPATGPDETASAEQERKAEQRERRAHLLPRHEFSTERWSALNADVRLKALRVEPPPGVPIQSFTAHLTLEDSVLRLQPLAFETTGGSIHSNVVLNANRSPLAAELNAEVRGLALSRVVPKVGSTEAASGPLSGRIELTGRGDSVARLLDTADGEITFAVSGGAVSGLLVELLGLDLGEALIVLASKNVKTQLNCAVADFAVENGLARVKVFVIDTRDTLVRIEGAIDLGDETFDLVARPQPKDVSVLSASSPVEITGPLRDPTVRPRAAPIAGRAAAAGLLAIVNPLLAVLPFIETGGAENVNCRALLERAKENKSTK